MLSSKQISQLDEILDTYIEDAENEHEALTSLIALYLEWCSCIGIDFDREILPFARIRAATNSLPEEL